MPVLDRSELQASPLSDLHLIADQIGLEGFRRLRKADLIDAILEQSSGKGREEEPSDTGDGDGPRRARRPRTRGRRRTSAARDEEPEEVSSEKDAPESDAGERDEQERDGERGREARRPAARATRGRRSASVEREAEGVVEVLGNGSAFLRLNHPEHSDEDVYISAAQVRRCELVSGDRVSGPLRTPRRSERYPSLVRVETINGEPADAVSEGTRYDDLPAAWPCERLAFGSEDPTLKAIEWLTPLGLGSRAVIAGASRSGKTEALRRIAAALAGREALEPMLALIGCRPEEVAEWQQGPLEPLVKSTLTASADAQSQAIEAVIETARRVAARGGSPVVLIDGLDGVHPHCARRVLAAARNIEGGGSLTVIATASRPFGGETTVIALDVAHTSTGRFPALDLPASGTLRAELLVGEQGAEEITRARAAAAS